MNKPIISSDFTIEDIHKIREYNYEILKDMPSAEKISYYNSKGKTAQASLEKLKQSRIKAGPNLLS